MNSSIFFLLWEVRNKRNPREFFPRINFPKSIGTFREDFRVDSEVADYILNGIGNKIKHQTTKNHALTPKQQLLCTLHFLGTNAQFHAIGTMHGIHKSSICRSIHIVIKAINVFFCRVVKWPENLHNIEQQFFDIAGFPYCAGIIDGTLINFHPSNKFEAGFVDRHNNHSINLTLVCGPNYEFFYSNACCSGSYHDSRVLRESNLWKRWNDEGDFGFFVLIGKA